VLFSIVGNISYAASMPPVIADLVGSNSDREGAAVGTRTGRRSGQRDRDRGQCERRGAGGSRPHGYLSGFWQFTRYGLVMSFMTIVVTWATSGCGTSPLPEFVPRAGPAPRLAALPGFVRPVGSAARSRRGG